MNHKFFDVDKEKQDRIINAALRVFAQAGYRHASTDDIVKRAGISKGLLFHYFESKLGLYSFLYDYSSRFMLLELDREMENMGREREKEAETDGPFEREQEVRKMDYFSYLRRREAAFMQVYRKYPYMRRFLEFADLEDCVEAVQAVTQMREAFHKRLLELEKQTDKSMLERWEDRKSENGRMAVRAIELTLKGIAEQESRKPDYTPEKLYQAICGYLDLYERLFDR